MSGRLQDKVALISSTARGQGAANLVIDGGWSMVLPGAVPDV